uniref:Endonuclease exonuclease phosphatase domain containing protein n=1 Tax=Haemonchus contortus TaxID=6289 RepID=A0A7I4Z2J9_HAECO
MPSRHGDCLRISTHNYRNISSKGDQTILIETSKKIRSEVIAFQEIKTKEAAIEKTNDGHLLALGAEEGFRKRRRRRILTPLSERTSGRLNRSTRPTHGHSPPTQ